MSPPLILSFLVASIYGLLFHLLWGESLEELAIYWPLSLIGFWLGQLLAGWLGLGLWLMGDIPLLEASLGSWVLLFLARWLKIR